MWYIFKVYKNNTKNKTQLKQVINIRQKENIHPKKFKSDLLNHIIYTSVVRRGLQNGLNFLANKKKITSYDSKTCQKLHQIFRRINYM